MGPCRRPRRSNLERRENSGACPGAGPGRARESLQFSDLHEEGRLGGADNDVRSRWPVARHHQPRSLNIFGKTRARSAQKLETAGRDLNAMCSNSHLPHRALASPRPLRSLPRAQSVLRAIGRRWRSRIRSGRPCLPRALLDVASNQPTHHLGRCRVLFGAQALEDRLLARVHEGRQASGSLFDGQAGSRASDIGG